MINPLNLCRVCGFHFEKGYLPWGDDGRSPTFDYCPCCGVEFGYQDCQESAATKFRGEWVEKGCLWSEPLQKPTRWRWEEQRENLGQLEALAQLKIEEANQQDELAVNQAVTEMRTLIASHALKWVKP